MAKKLYILKTVGINLPDYDRKDLRVGMSVELEQKVGDKIAERGFLVKANAAAKKTDKASKALTDKVAELEKANAELSESNKALTEELAVLKVN